MYFVKKICANTNACIHTYMYITALCNDIFNTPFVFLKKGIMQANTECTIYLANISKILEYILVCMVRVLVDIVS